VYVCSAINIAKYLAGVNLFYTICDIDWIIIARMISAKPTSATLSQNAPSQFLILLTKLLIIFSMCVSLCVVLLKTTSYNNTVNIICQPM